MAECSHARCMQERRAIRKQLQRWTKNMVYVVGLERVAEELMGRRKWRQLGTIGTWDDPSATAWPADGHPNGPQDFEPRQDLQCCFCDDPLDTSTRIASDSEDDSGSVASEGSACAFLPPIGPNMTTLEAVTSMAASLAAVAAFKSSQGSNSTSAPTSATSTSPTTAPGLYPLSQPATAAGLLPAWYLSSPHAAAVAAVAAAAHHHQQQQQQQQSATHGDSHSLASSPVPGPSPGAGPSPSSVPSPGTCSPGGALGGALMGVSSADMPMPLDLSAKAAAIAALALDSQREALRVPDSKNIFKARPRANTALTQRRTYTEEELQAALRDIQSGKLGTRRAAVIYGIPRSTLRNKVYKLSMERKCDPASLVLAGADPSRLPLGALALPVDDEDGVISGGEEDADKPLSKSPLDSPAALAPESLRLLLQHGMRSRRSGGASEESEEGASPPPSGLPPTFPGAGLGGLDYQSLAPYISKLLGAHQSLLGLSPATTPTPDSPGGPGADVSGRESGRDSDFLPKFTSPLLPDFLYRMMAEERELQQRQPFHNGAGDGDDKRSTASPSMGTKTEADEDGAARPTSPPNVILKIPSFKPTSKNGVEAPVVFPRCGSGSGGESSQHSEHSAAPVSAPIAPGPAVPPPAVSPPTSQILANKALAAKFPHLRLGPTSPIFDLKRVHYGGAVAHHPMTESVIKSMQHQQQQQANRQNSSAGQQASGKGTRPKRGKYRNYDRDALNEAVKAVQRGEMSVHRAGSYYGVPHSTLEYKVKERHLMRPRKRDPKPVEPDKPKPESNVLRMSPGDKMPMLNASKPKTFIQPPLGAPQNGLKARFDPAALPSLAYPSIPPFPFWSPGYPLPLDFSGQAIGQASFNSNTKQFLASQMMQRLQDTQDSSRNSSASGPPLVQGAPGGPPGPGPGSSPGSSPGLTPGLNLGATPGANSVPGAAALALSLKRSRDAEDTMDDSSSDNNTLLDGIIRYGLEKGLPTKDAVEKLANNALLDQLCRSRLDGHAVRPRTSSSSEDDEVRRPPLSLLQTNVVHLSPSSDGSAADREDKNSHYGPSEDGDREENDRLPRPTMDKPFHVNHSPPQGAQSARLNQDCERPASARPSRPDSHPSAVNGLEAARSTARTEEDGPHKSACDSKLIDESRASGAGPEEDGAKDSSEDQVREDTKTQDIS